MVVGPAVVCRGIGGIGNVVDHSAPRAVARKLRPYVVMVGEVEVNAISVVEVGVVLARGDAVVVDAERAVGCWIEGQDPRAGVSTRLPFTTLLVAGS